MGERRGFDHNGINSLSAPEKKSYSERRQCTIAAAGKHKLRSIT